MQKSAYHISVILASVFVFLSPNTNAQIKDMLLSLPEEYNFSIKKDTTEKGFTLISYDATDYRTKENPFEIMVTLMDNSLAAQPMDIRIRNILQSIQAHTPSAQLKLIKEEANIKKLWQIDSKDEKNTRSILMLMQQLPKQLMTVEMEIPREELAKVSLQRWQDIFWNVKGDL